MFFDVKITKNNITYFLLQWDFFKKKYFNISWKNHESYVFG